MTKEELYDKLYGMKEISEKEYEKVAESFPRQRGNVRIDNRTMLNALLYINENGCKWRALPEKYGKWYTIHQRIRRWAESGVLAGIFESLQKQLLLDIEIEVVALDSTCVKVHPDGTGALKKTVNRILVKQKADGTPRFTWLPPMIKR